MNSNTEKTVASDIEGLEEFKINLICIGNESDDENFFRDVAEIIVKNNNEEVER